MLYSSLNMLLESIVWVIVGIESIAPICAAVPIPTAMAAERYTAFKCQ